MLFNFSRFVLRLASTDAKDIDNARRWLAANGYTDVQVTFVTELTASIPVLQLPPLRAGDIFIDVGTTQLGKVDYPLAAQHSHMVCVKCTEGLTFVSPAWLEHWNGFRNLTLRSAYHFYRFDVRRPREQARHFVQTVFDAGSGNQPEGFWIVDLEHWPGATDEQMQALRPYMQSDLELFFSELHANTVPVDRTAFYSRASWLNHWLPGASFLTNYRAWLAGYPFVWPNPNYKVRLPQTFISAGQKVSWHQYDNGQMPWSQAFPGVTGPVDKSIVVWDGLTDLYEPII